LCKNLKFLKAFELVAKHRPIIKPSPYHDIRKVFKARSGSNNELTWGVQVRMKKKKQVVQ